MSAADNHEVLLDRARVVIRQLREKLAAVQASSTEPIAVIGMDCRFPGEAVNTRALWQLIEAGGCATSEIPPERWDIPALYDPDPASKGKISTRYGGFIKNVDQFDARFFDISPREAVSMDPQQRLFLEVGWHALEDAGQVREKLAGSDTGVFVGVHSLSNDYSGLQSEDLSSIDTYTGPGTGQDVIAGRLAYWLDLHGPCVAVNTACSSSLVAVHLARRSLLARDCRMAVVGGVNLILKPASMVMISRLSMLSPDGRCKSFDARADGFGRGEGCGAIVLKRLADARADGDPILAVIRSSALNQDGRTNGLTAPNGLSQQRVIRKALQEAGLEGADIGYIEAHGTGTELGDPIEVEALAEVLGSGAGSPCALGTVKANIGHLEGAAGIAGVIKAVLTLRHRVIPPVAGLEKINPHLALEGTRLFLPREAQPWAAQNGGRFAGVSSFGWSGTNAHIILAEAPEEVADHSAPIGRAVIVPLSAPTTEALREAATGYADRLDTTAANDLPDFAYTAAVRRTHHELRIAVAGSTREALAEGFRRRASQLLTPASAKTKTTPKLAFIYSGQGQGNAIRGQQLLREEPEFRRCIEACAEEVRACGGWDLVAQIEAPLAPDETDAERSQALIFALQAALTELVRSWGIRPDAIAGHSLGEVAGAWAAGVLTLKDAVRLVIQRGKAMRRTAGLGITAAIGAPLETVRNWIAGESSDVAIAAVNSPGATVVSGRRAAVERMIAWAGASAIPSKVLTGNYAFHAPLMHSAAAELVRQMQGLSVGKSAVPLYSTVSGGPARAGDFGPEYWGRNLQQTVLFRHAIEAIGQAGCSHFLEFGPGAALTPMITECGDSRQQAIPLLRTGAPERLSALSAAAALYESGIELDWARLSGGGKCIELPPYPYQRQRYWIPARSAAQPPSAAPEDWYYETAWREVAFSGDESALQTGHWLILADQGGLGERLLEQIRTRGGTATLARQDDAGSLSRGLENGASPVYSGIVNLSGLNDGSGLTPASDAEALTWQAVSLHQHLAQRPTAVRVWTVTQGAQSIPGDNGPISLAQAGLLGLSRTLALEHPEQWGGLVDLDPLGSQSANAAMLVRQILAEDGEDEVAFRGGRRLAARISRNAAPPRVETRLNPDATYVLTGAFGGIGLEVARWLVDRGARHLVLLGRSAPNTKALDVLREFESRGVHIRSERCDVADRERLTEVFDALGGDWPAVRGVVHAAAAIALKPLRALSRADVRATFFPKALGGWNLHQLFKDRPLDFLVYFSSASAALGAREMADYAASNQFLDALACERRRQGLAASSIAWGAWDVVRAATPEQRESIRRSGFEAMPAELALEAMGRIMASPRPQQIVMRTDWSVLKPAMEMRGRKQFVREMLRPSELEPAAPFDDRLPRIRSARPEARRDMLVEFVTAEVRLILGLKPADPVDSSCGFFQLGMDSLMTVELKNRLERLAGSALPGTLTLNYPTVDALAEYLDSRMADVPNSGSIAQGTQTTELEVDGRELEELSDAEARQALLAELSAWGGDLRE